MNVFRLSLVCAMGAVPLLAAEFGGNASTAVTEPIDVAPRGAAAAFTFDLPNEGVTSAGIFAKDRLIKTLWSNVKLSDGKHTGSWTGETDDGERAPSGTYAARVLSNQAKYTWEGVIGNTSASFSGPTLHHAEDIAYGMAIAGGNLYIAAGYNEGRSATLKSSITNPQTKSYILPTTAAHGYTDTVTHFVATDGNYVYWAGYEGSLAPNNHFVYATQVSDDHEVTFPEGQTVAINHGAIKHSAVDHLDSLNGYCTGLAVQKEGPYLIVSHGELNEIHVLNKTTGALVKTISFSTPTALASDGTGHLWIAHIQNDKPVISKYTIEANGDLTSIAQHTINGLDQPLAMAVSPDHRTLLLADGGENQQLRAYDNTSAKPLWTYGQKGGYAISPDVSDDKFFFRNIDNISRHVGGFPWTFLAWQPDGSFWVGDSGNYRSQHYSPDRKCLGRIMWLPTFYTALVDLNNAERVFADLLEFHVDYSKSLAPDNGSWKLVRNWAGHEPPLPYFFVKGGQRTGFFPWLTVATLKNGRTYATFRNFPASKLDIAELDPHTGLRFTGIETSGLNSNLAADGSIHTLSHTDKGKPLIWSLQPLTGFDSEGNPQWGPPQTIAQSAPVDPKVFDHAPYSSSIPIAWEMTSHGILPSFDGQAPLTPSASAAVSHTGWHLAGFDPQTASWRWKTAPSTLRTYLGDWPTDGSFDIGNRVGNSGTAYHVIGDNILWGYLGEGWKGGDAGEVNMWTLVHDDGLMVGQFGVQQSILLNGKEDEGQLGMAGNASSHGIVARPDGVVYIYHNDEGFHGGIHRWRVDNLSSIHEQEIPMTYQASAPVITQDAGDLLQGLPRDSSVTEGTSGWHRSPANDVLNDRHLDWWRVQTNITQYRKDVSPDIDISFGHRPASAGTVTRDLPKPDGPIANWKLAGILRIGWPNVGTKEGLNLEILDEAGKVIAQITPIQVAPHDYRLQANGQSLYTEEDQRIFSQFLHHAISFSIEAKDGKVIFTCNDRPKVIAACLDSAAQWRSPKTLQVHAWSTWGGYHHELNFQTLRFDYQK